MTVLTSTGFDFKWVFQGRNTIQEPRSHATHLGSQIENENHLGIPLITVVVTIFGCYNHGPGGGATHHHQCNFPTRTGLVSQVPRPRSPKRKGWPSRKTVKSQEKESSGSPRFLLGFLEEHVAWLVKQRLKIIILTGYIWILFKVDRLEPRNWEHKSVVSKHE